LPVLEAAPKAAVFDPGSAGQHSLLDDRMDVAAELAPHVSTDVATGHAGAVLSELVGLAATGLHAPAIMPGSDDSTPAAQA